MPDFDVSDILDDLDFADDELICERRNQSVGNDGMTSITPEIIQFSGVVTAYKGDFADQRQEGTYVAGSILIHSGFKLRMAGIDVSPDIVTANGKRYTVKEVGDYSNFGDGFVWAVCEPISYSG